MAALWMFFLFTLVSAIPPRQRSRWPLSVSMAGSSPSVETCMDGNVEDELTAESWCMQCEPGQLVTSVATLHKGISILNCTDSQYVQSDMLTTINCDPKPMTADESFEYQCPEDEVMIGYYTGMDYSMMPMATVISPDAIRCAKLIDRQLNPSTDCRTAHISSQDSTVECPGDNEVLQGLVLLQSALQLICCTVTGGDIFSATSGTTTEAPGNITELAEGVVKIPMSICLEVDPFYTDCGASCWSGQLNSNYVIHGVKVNGSAVNEVHCQKQENITLSLIQLNKFVLQLYPFMVCPTNYLVTALWSESHSNQELKTIKCNLLYPGLQMTNCELFDAENDLAFCDTANGYYMGGLMLDDQKGITQVMCCHVIEFDLTL